MHRDNELVNTVVQALVEIAPEFFGVSAEIFLKALRRDAATWQLSWKAVDVDGIEACLAIQRKLGVNVPKNLAAAELFAIIEEP